MVVQNKSGCTVKYKAAFQKPLWPFEKVGLLFYSTTKNKMAVV
jgi:hypothetical protein